MKTIKQQVKQSGLIISDTTVVDTGRPALITMTKKSNHPNQVPAKLKKQTSQQAAVARYQMAKIKKKEKRKNMRQLNTPT